MTLQAITAIAIVVGCLAGMVVIYRQHPPKKDDRQ